MKNKDEIENILLRFKVGQKTLDESTKAICDLFNVSLPFCVCENPRKSCNDNSKCSKCKGLLNWDGS